MLVLGIESTCDETACAVVKDGLEILSNVVSSQIDLHREYGGVVPELACRRHVDLLFPVLEESLKDAKTALKAIDLIAVSQGPGLIGALLIGFQAAKSLAYTLNKPYVGINHIEAHLYACMMSHEITPVLPCLGVVLSGGHTAIIYMEQIGKYRLIGQTVDDAIGESFDKVAKLLSYPYPGGPHIEKLAVDGDPHRYPFKGGKVKGSPYHFSFSGLKTAVLYTLKQQPEFSPQDIAASFQRAAFEDVIHKVKLAAKEYNCKNILLGGGVTNSQTLRTVFSYLAPELHLYWPSRGLSLDNAAMIAGLGYHQYKGQADPWDLEPLSSMPFEG